MGGTEVVDRIEKLGSVSGAVRVSEQLEENLTLLIAHARSD